MISRLKQAMGRHSQEMILGAAYLFTFGLMLFNGGAFLDDWVIVNQESAVRLVMQKEIGFFGYWPAYVHNILLSLPAGIFLERLVIFLSYLLAGFLLNGILKSIREIDEESRFWVVMFFMIFPVNFVRICISNINYALSYLLFFAGFGLLVKFRRGGSIAVRLASLVCLFLSFSTNSLLVFYIVVIAYIIYAELKDKCQTVSLITRAAAYADFTVLPVVFWAIKNAAFPPHGLYAGYNIMNAQKAFAAVSLLPACFYHSIVEPIRFSAGHGNMLVMLVAACALYFAVRRRSMSQDPVSARLNLLFAGMGAIIFVAAVYPYLAVGKMPSLWDAESRHQLLVPLGGALMTVYGLKLLLQGCAVPPVYRRMVFAAGAGFFMASHVVVQLDFQRDHFKQLSLLEQFRASDSIRAEHAFVFVDNLAGYNALQRRYRFYEFSGMMKIAFGEQTRIGITRGLEPDSAGEYASMIPYPQYNISGYGMQPFSRLISIERGNAPLSLRTTARLMLLQICCPERFTQNLRGYVHLGSAAYQPG